MLGRIIVGAVGVLLLIGMLTRESTPATTSSSNSARSNAVTMPMVTSTPAPPAVYISGAHCERSGSGGFIYSIGEITNKSNESLKSVRVVVSLRDSAGSIITTDTAYIEIDPLLPGQSSPYKAMSRFNPAIADCQVDGVQYRGGRAEMAVSYS